MLIKIFIYADTDSMTTHIGLFQILFLGSCPLSTDWKISLISLARYVISGQSNTETESSFRHSIIRIRFQINYHSLEKYANFVHRQGAGIRLEGEKVMLRSPKITATYMFISSLSRFCPSLAGLLVHDEEKRWAMAEMTPKIINCVAAQSLMTLSLQVDLVLSDVAATVSHNVFS